MADLQLAWIRPTFESLKVMHVDNVCTILVSTSRNCFAVRLVDTHVRHFYMPIFGSFPLSRFAGPRVEFAGSR